MITLYRGGREKGREGKGRKIGRERKTAQQELVEERDKKRKGGIEKEREIMMWEIMSS